MNNNEKYRKVIDIYTDTFIEDEKVMQAVQEKNIKIKKATSVRKFIAVGVAAALTLTCVTIVGATSGWSISDLFRNIFNDPISAEITEAGGVQTLDLVCENDDFILKLKAFTGDKETQIALFELIPKIELADFDYAEMKGKTITSFIVEEEMHNQYGSRTMYGYKLDYDIENNTYYFSYELPVFWVRDTNEDLIINVNGLNFYRDNQAKELYNINMMFQFTPNREMLVDSFSINIDKPITKYIFKNFAGRFINEDENSYTKYANDVISPMTEATVFIEKAVISKYSVEIYGNIDGSLSNDNANNVWNQFSEPNFVAHHYYDGIEKIGYYDVVGVINTERIRLFVDDIEISVNEETLKWFPGKGHDTDDEDELQKRDYGCGFKFNGIDYENAQSVEIRFGDVVIPLK